MTDRLAQDLVEAFDALFGKNPGVRAAHAKGTCCEAIFTATPAAASLTKAAHLQGPPVRAIVRFSNGSGDPAASDAGREPRGMAIKFFHPDGHTTDIVSINHPVFIVRTPEEVLEFMHLRVPDPATGQLDFAALAAFVGARPSSQRAAQLLLSSPPLESFLRTDYFAIHAFRFVAADGSQRYGRYRWKPALGAASLTGSEAAARGPEYLREDLLDRLAKEPASFTLHLQIAEDGDDAADSTIEWPAERAWVQLGRLEISGPVADQVSDCERQLFDPTRLCDGIEPSDDPVLNARPRAYAISSKRRLQD